jgi:GAF domain-containing protein
MTGDALLLATLALFNESDDIDATLQKSLALLTATLGGRVGEIWLRMGDARQVALQYSSSDGSAGVLAFEAEGRALGLGSGPAVVSRVVRTGRGSTVASTVADGWGGRATEAAAANIRGALTFPIRSRSGVIGVLAVFREITERPQPDVLTAVHAVCHHMGRFLERVRAESAIHEAAMELSALESTDSLHVLKNRRE